jgi:hypothetical protein
MWPELASPGWQEASTTLHLYSQIIGKARLACAPMMNHWWQVTLYLSARGLTTSPMRAGGRLIEIELDLVSHRLEIRASDGGREGFALEACPTVADFHARFFRALGRLGVIISINPMAVEIAPTIHLDQDRTPRRYDAGWAGRFFAAMSEVVPVFNHFRGRFIGKASPVHFFWGGFDLAATRFSGRRAPRYTNPIPHVRPYVMEEAYSHEVSSAGFWPGGVACPEPAFYAYAYPEPEGFAGAEGLPDGARYDTTFREYLFPYETVRTAASPVLELERFLEITYDVEADLAHWNRAELERPDEPPPHWEEETHGLPV